MSEAAVEVPGAALGRELWKRAFCATQLLPQAALPNCFPSAVCVAVLGFSLLTSQTINPFLLVQTVVLYSVTCVSYLCPCYFNIPTWLREIRGCIKAVCLLQKLQSKNDYRLKKQLYLIARIVYSQNQYPWKKKELKAIIKSIRSYIAMIH